MGRVSENSDGDVRLLQKLEAGADRWRHWVVQQEGMERLAFARAADAMARPSVASRAAYLRHMGGRW